MKIKLLSLQIAVYCLLIQQVTGQPTWQSQESPVVEDLISVSFSDSIFGWAVTKNGKVIHTADGGEQWDLISSLEGFIPQEIFFQNRDTGWMVGSYTIYVDTSYILRSNDGGLSWNMNYKRIASKLNDIYFVNDLVGYAVGFEGDTICLRMKTNTGGNSWQDLWGPKIVSEFYSVYFRDTANGVMCGSGPTLQFTRTGGIKPPGMAQSMFNFEKEMFDLVSVGSIYGCMVGADGKLWFTKDDWNNYIDYDFPDGDTLRAVDGLEPLSFYVVGDRGTILVVGYNQFLGVTAMDMSYDTDDNLLAIDAVDDAHIWAVGENGTILFFGFESGTPQTDIGVQLGNSINVYPNPAGDIIRIRSERDNIEQILMINDLGQYVLQKNSGSRTTVINAAGIKPGFYFLQIHTTNSVVVRKNPSALISSISLLFFLGTSLNLLIYSDFRALIFASTSHQSLRSSNDLEMDRRLLPIW